MKLYQDKDWLYEQYHIKGLSQQKIGEICGISKHPVGCLIRKFKIEKLIKQHQNKDWLYKKYIIEKLSINKIANSCFVARKTISDWIKKHNILKRSRSEANHYARGNHFNVTQKLREFIDGELLGDGCLQSNGYSARFHYSSKYKNYLFFLSNFFEKNKIKQTGKILSYYHKQFDCFTYNYSSRRYSEFLSFYYHWYPKGKKIVPRDIELTPLTCRQWYIGDGCLVKYKKRCPYIIFYTDGFSISDVELLIQELNKLGFKSNREKNRNLVHISTHSTKDFLNYIGKCPVQCYQYKWDY